MTIMIITMTSDPPMFEGIGTKNGKFFKGDLKIFKDKEGLNFRGGGAERF